MCSEKHSGIHKDLNPDATEEQIAEWEKMIEELEERKRKEMMPNDNTDQ